MANELRSPLGDIDEGIAPETDGCGECLDTGDDWARPLLCLTWGNAGCCDDPKNEHATKRHHATKHPIVRSHEPGEKRPWCYVDKVGFES